MGKADEKPRARVWFPLSSSFIPSTGKPWGMDLSAELVPVEALGLVKDESEVLPMGRGYLTWRGGSRRVAGPCSYRIEAVAKGVPGGTPSAPTKGRTAR